MLMDWRGKLSDNARKVEKLLVERGYESVSMGVHDSDEKIVLVDDGYIIKPVQGGWRAMNRAEPQMNATFATIEEAAAHIGEYLAIFNDVPRKYETEEEFFAMCIKTGLNKGNEE